MGSCDSRERDVSLELDAARRDFDPEFEEEFEGRKI